MDNNCVYNSKSNQLWLVVSTPLKNISQLGLFFPIYGKIKNVPNHQPDLYIRVQFSKTMLEYRQV